MAEIQPPLAPMNNWDIANVIWGMAGPDYQARVPLATQANFAETLEAMWDWTPNRNQFIPALVNQIGLTIFKNRVWNNKLAKFKRPMLRRGETIQEIAVGIAKAHVYDPTRDFLEKEIFGREPNEVQSFYHVRNRADMYKVTVDETQLQLAFLRDEGLWEFVNALLNSAYTGDNYDEFLIMVQLFKQYHRLGGFYKINVPDITRPETTALEAQRFLRALRAIAPSLEYPSRNYNAAALPVWADQSELLLIINSEAQASTDVLALSAAFNPANTDITTKTVVLPPEHFPIEGGIAILTTPDFFVAADTKYETREAENPVALIRNFFLHHHGVYSASAAVPAILFTYTEPSTVIQLENDPVTSVAPIVVADKDGVIVTQLVRGNEYAVFSEAVTTPEGGSAKAVAFNVVSAANGPLSPMTQWTQTGTLRVPVNEPSTSLTISAAATDSDYPRISAEVTLPVVGTYVRLPLPREVIMDADNDGLPEVIPEIPARVGNLVTIPEENADKLQYKKAGANVAAGSSSTLTETTAYSVAAKAGYEIKAGSPVSWSFTVPA